MDDNSDQQARKDARKTSGTLLENSSTFETFAAGLAHEIKNPLAGIVGVIEILGQDLPDDSPTREVWQDVRKELRRIEDILNDVSEYARPKPLDIREANLNETTERAIESAQKKVSDKSIEFNFIPDQSISKIKYDPAKIQQVLENLLLNAIHAIDKEGIVEVHIQLKGDFAVIAVTDRGRGIDPGQIANIFRPFFSMRRKRTGLELPLAQRVVAEHRGWIEVTSTPSEGTRFSVFLPVAGITATDSFQSDINA